MIEQSNMLDSLQQAILDEDKKKREQNGKKEYRFDKLAMYFGKDYEINGIKISVPTIGDILDIGEQNFYQSLSPFLYNSTSIRVMLWDMGIDWCKVKDIEVFSILTNIPGQNQDGLKYLFKDTDITQFKVYKKKKDENSEEEFCMYNKDLDIELSEDNFMEMAEYIREMMNIHPKVEKAKGKTAKKWMLDEDRLNAIQQKDNNKSTSTLLPLVSTLVNHSGFKYKVEDLYDVNICQFMDAVQRIQIYEATRALTDGSYSGFCDTSKIPKENFNFFREIN